MKKLITFILAIITLSAYSQTVEEKKAGRLEAMQKVQVDQNRATTQIQTEQEKMLQKTRPIDAAILKKKKRQDKMKGKKKKK